VSDPQGEAEAEAAAEQVVPARTTPTWEMEMLLSGATVFGLLQFPAALNAATEPVLARLGGGLAIVASILALYAGTAVYLLLATFIGHLTIRGFWIALLGVRSVFPEGPDFSRLRGGPIAREVARGRTPRVDVEAERLDNLATIVFAFGAFTVVGVLMPALFVLPMMLAAWIWPGVSIGSLMIGLLAIGLGPLAVVTLLDSWFGRRLDPAGRVARALAAVLAMYQASMQPRFMNVISTTLMTRLGFGRFMTAYLTILVVVLSSYAVHARMRREGAALGDFKAIPANADSGFAVLPQHYRDQRQAADRLRRVPYLDSAVLAGDWLRLVVPYHPTRHEAAISARCPEVWAELPGTVFVDADGARAAHLGLLSCYRDIAAIRIDGRAVPVLPDVVVMPGSRLRGLQFMIDARDLAGGRHVLETAMLPDSEDDDAGAKPASYRIPFWK
jgi:hypothetical protein